MTRKTSTSFRSIWLGIPVLPLTNLAMAHDYRFAGKGLDFSTSFKLKRVSSKAKVKAINSTKCAYGNIGVSMLQKQNTITFSEIGFGTYYLHAVANQLTNVSISTSLITKQDSATIAPYLSSRHSI